MVGGGGGDRWGLGGSDLEGGWGGGIGVGAEEETEWKRENRVGGRGKSNVAGTTYGSKVASNNP